MNSISDTYRSIAAPAKGVYKELGSKFLAFAYPVETEEEAKNILASVRKEYFDARHHCFAWRLGLTGEPYRLSDDGEPSGTAGRPVLDVLKGRNCSNLVLTITRWFGGTLLGTGGLVKAYGGGAKKVLEEAEKQNAFSPLVEKTDFDFATDYSLYKIIKFAIKDFTLFDVTEDFSTEIKIKGKIKSDEFLVFSKKLKDLSNGKINLE